MASALEMRFLALCLPRMPGDSLDLTKDLPSMDWTAFLGLARLHGMMPLVASHLLASNPPLELAVPSQAISQLSAYQNIHVIRTLIQTAALLELQREFDRHDVRVIPWKGSSMAMLVYGSATLRESVDLDFLLLKQDIQTILQITRALGYRLLGTSDSESKDIYILSQQREFTFARKRDRLVLEFHLQVLPARFGLWQNSQLDVHRADTILTAADVNLRLQNPEDLLVSLCAHATKHHWDRLKWSCDIAQFIRVYSSQIAWKPFLNRLHNEKKDAVVLLGLALAGMIFAVKLPDEVSQNLQHESAIRLLAEELATHVMSGSSEVMELKHRKAILALLCPRVRDRFSYVIRPIIELNYQDLYIPVQNQAFFFLNYGFRVIRLLRKYGPHLLLSKITASLRPVR
ncbi:nucleotidyltransferase domain-containing protein [Granulicella arctica]|uniref:nucleotidyltransferase domain-containing protein n=1 Tax=Granulicella arctica TaxID=940613 RepID=UPI0021E05F15|nr:nucleotidyltransferase family protein [Granulicella arctica]